LRGRTKEEESNEREKEGSKSTFSFIKGGVTKDLSLKFYD
jgi:hypothetical protein